MASRWHASCSFAPELKAVYQEEVHRRLTMHGWNLGSQFALYTRGEQYFIGRKVVRSGGENWFYGEPVEWRPLENTIVRNQWAGIRNSAWPYEDMTFFAIVNPARQIHP